MRFRNIFKEFFEIIRKFFRDNLVIILVGLWMLELAEINTYSKKVQQSIFENELGFIAVCFN